MQHHADNKNLRYKRTALAIALACGVGSGTLLAQSTSGSIYGTADPGAQVSAINEGNGSTRTITVGQDGRYQFNSLLPGTYKVNLAENGKTSSQEVTVLAGQGANVNLAVTAAAASSAQNLSTISVTASAMPSIDVSSVQTNTVVTAEQMKQLPIAKNVTAIALLTPGAVKGDSAFGNLASFGGASVAENSYYVNGFNVTNQFDSLSFSQVPFEAIDQETVQDGGYGAEYGNSTGGVVSVTTKRGTNEWKGGVDVTWNPSSMMASEPNVYLNNGNVSYVASGNKNATMGNNGSWNSVDFTSRWNAWVGGPLIKDKLFVFALVSQTKTDSSYYNPVDEVGSGGYQSQTQKDPYWLLKLDWNINDSNILEYTGFNDTRHYNTDVYYSGFTSSNTPYHYDYQGVINTKAGGQNNILKYTSYITDDFTLTAQYGQNQNSRYNTATAADGTVETYNGLITNEASGCPVIIDERNPVLAGTATPYSHCNFVPGDMLTAYNSKDSRQSFRIDLEWKLGDHDITGGWSRDVTTSEYGQAYEGGALWEYLPDSSTSNGTASENYVEKIVYNTGAKVNIVQRAEYLQDNWHITDDFLARIGLRNDQFSNQNALGQTFVSQGHDLQPRLGFSWDVHGDSTLKVYGSAGDYSLPIDAGVAIRGAAASLYSYQTFDYTGVNSVTGAPTGLTALSPVEYANAESGVAPAASSYAPQGLKPFKQREFVLGAQQELDGWTLGVKGIVRHILTGLDDECDFRPIAKYADSVYGFDYSTTSLSPELANGDAVASTLNGCFINNPGDGATLYLPLDPAHPNKLYKVVLSGSEIGEPQEKRGYYALEWTAERNFNNKYYLNMSYTLARSYGNTEGLVDSNIGQADTGTTELFDYPEIMIGNNGNQTNDHRHTLKAYGAWRITDEWQVGANLIGQTGRPENCYGDAPVDSTISGYGSTGGSPYLYCYFNGVGEWVTRGSAGTTPTLWQLDLSGSYHPKWMKGLTLRATVFNVFNKHTVLSVNENQNASNGALLYIDTTYLTATGYQAPRYLQLNAEYDF